MAVFVLCFDDDEDDNDVCFSAPQSKCDHDIVCGVVKVFVLGDAEEDQQVEDQHQGGEGGVASHLHKVRGQFSGQRKRIHGHCQRKWAIFPNPKIESMKRVES